MTKEPLNRRLLGRALTRIANASVADALAGLAHHPPLASRIGVTGPPGAGKSTLIARLARRRLDHGATLAVIAIDPTSPYTHGALLGDRIRMEQVAEDSRLFIRSLASRSAHDGLADNIADILATLDGYPFDETILETVGVGQAEYAVRTLVDTLVLVLIPESGDQIQAMKAGMLETADIYVVNKADLPGAEKIAGELRAITARRRDGAAWTPPVILCAPRDEGGLETLDAAITRHLAFSRAAVDPRQTLRRRTEYHLKSLIQRSVEEILNERPDLLDAQASLGELFADVAKRLYAHAMTGVPPSAAGSARDPMRSSPGLEETI
jgi:LAO/AO transport system kinase